MRVDTTQAYPRDNLGKKRSERFLGDVPARTAWLAAYEIRGNGIRNHGEPGFNVASSCQTPTLSEKSHNPLHWPHRRLLCTLVQGPVIPRRQGNVSAARVLTLRDKVGLARHASHPQHILSPRPAIWPGCSQHSSALAWMFLGYLSASRTQSRGVVLSGNPCVVAAFVVTCPNQTLLPALGKRAVGGSHGIGRARVALVGNTAIPYAIAAIEIRVRVERGRRDAYPRFAALGPLKLLCAISRDQATYERRGAELACPVNHAAL